MKKLLVLLSPLGLFLVLLYPYSLFNRAYVIDWFGCSCPRVDKTGKLVTDFFSANDFTELFWLAVALCTVLLSLIPASRVLKGRVGTRVIYHVGILAASLALCIEFTLMMQWK